MTRAWDKPDLWFDTSPTSPTRPCKARGMPFFKKMSQVFESRSEKRFLDRGIRLDFFVSAIKIMHLLFLLDGDPTSEGLTLSQECWNFGTSIFCAVPASEML